MNNQTAVHSNWTPVGDQTTPKRALSSKRSNESYLRAFPNFIASVSNIRIVASLKEKETMIKSFQHEYTTANIVIWEEEIWQAAIANAEAAFRGHPVTLPETNESLIFMFNPTKLLTRDYLMREFPFLALPAEDPLLSVYVRTYKNKEDKQILMAWIILNPTLEKEGVAALQEIEASSDQERIIKSFLPFAPRLMCLDRVISNETIFYERANLIIYDILAAYLFLQLPFVGKEKIGTGMIRAERRRWQKEGANISDVRTVVLRRVEKHTTPEREPGETQKNWKHRWLVGAHWRNQWYPSEGTHRQKYIAPFMKGPIDAPMMPAREKIFTAVR